MKKFYFGASFLIITNIYGIPIYTGAKGLHKIISAEPHPLGRFHYVFGLRGFWHKSKDTIPLQFQPKYDMAGNRPEGDYIKGTSAIFDISLGLGFSFTDYLSLNTYEAFYIDGMETEINETGSSALSYGFGDIELGMQFTPTKLFKFIPNIDIGLQPTISFPTGYERTPLPDSCGSDTVWGEPTRVNEGGLHRFYTYKRITYGGKFLLTIKKLKEPQVHLHFNLGMLKYEFLKGDARDIYSYGVGIETIYPRFQPFLEFYGEKRRNKAYDDGGIYITPGLRFETTKNFWTHIIVGFRVSEKREDYINDELYIQKGLGTTPPWYISFILSQGFDFIKPPPQKGIVKGKVTDEESGNPVQAIVWFPAFDTSVTTDIDGNYEIELLARQTMIYATPIKKDKYKQSPEMTIYIEPNTKKVVNFALTPIKVAKSVLAGTVVDKTTKKPIFSANISFAGTDFSPILTNEDGAYKIELPPGTYSVKIEKTNYVPWIQTIELLPDKTTIFDVELSPIAPERPKLSTIAGKVTEYGGTHKPIYAKISFVGTEIPPITTDPETGTYMKEIPSGTYTVRVEAEGYVSEGDVIVCDPGATLIKDFELFKKEERIVLRGITFEYNSAEIKISSYPILDEAVELLKKHPQVRVEIGGHTCTIGSYAYNIKLSQLRAESVMKYLIEHGISANRLIARGYGPTHPIAPNDTEAGRSLNRRIEFKILSE